MTIITVYDQVGSSEPSNALTLEFLTERVTVRELIRRRVYQEVTEYNARQSEYFRGLVQPTDAERTLNGYRLQNQRQLDWKAQYQKAIEAFLSNGFLILVDDRQVLDLDEEITLRHDTDVVFLKLVPLVGG